MKIVWSDFWHKEWPEADCIFTFLLPRYMAKLDEHIKVHSSKPISLVSFAFKIPLKPIVKEAKGVYLYEYTSSY